VIFCRNMNPSKLGTSCLDPLLPKTIFINQLIHDQHSWAHTHSTTTFHQNLSNGHHNVKPSLIVPSPASQTKKKMSNLQSQSSSSTSYIPPHHGRDRAGSMGFLFFFLFFSFLNFFLSFYFKILIYSKITKILFEVKILT
jgi:hypothetical protein